MIFLPIVDRELRVAARRRSIYWVRAGFALGAIVIGGFIYLANLRSSQQEFANNLFAALAFLSMLYCLVAGVRLTADCLSEEKREGTLGLLFLTDLRGYDVVLGKLAATSISGLFGLLAIFPVLAIPLLLGGLTNGEFWRMVLVLATAFLFSLAAGVFISAFSKSARRAMALTFILVLFFTAILPGCAGLILMLTPSHQSQFADALLFPCPIYSMAMSEDSEYRTAKWHFWTSVGSIQGLTCIFLLLACWLIPRAWQDKPAAPRIQRWQEFWRRWTYGSALQRQRLRQRMLEINAFSWLAGRGRLRPAYVWAFLGLVACLWSWGWIKAGSEWLNEGIFFPTAIFLNSVLKLWVASVSGRQLGEDRKAGTLELLLSTPLTVRDILRGQLLALIRQFLWPFVLVVGVEIIFLMASLRRESFQANPLNPTVWIAGMIMLIADITALIWVSMWTALTAKSPNRVTSFTVVRILLAPWIVYIGILIIVVSIRSLNSLPEPKWQFHVGLWFGLGLLTDIGFGLFAWWQVRTRFRQLALQRPVPVTSRLARFFRRRKPGQA
jgi:ABC-type transport system involved in multi-copper enzyme maturation permease subunit